MMIFYYSNLCVIEECFREDIFKKCVLSKKDNNNKFKFIRKFCNFYYSKNYSGK